MQRHEQRGFQVHDDGDWFWLWVIDLQATIQRGDWPPLAEADPYKPDGPPGRSPFWRGFRANLESARVTLEEANEAMFRMQAAPRPRDKPLYRDGIIPEFLELIRSIRADKLRIFDPARDANPSAPDPEGALIDAHWAKLDRTERDWYMQHAVKAFGPIAEQAAKPGERGARWARVLEAMAAIEAWKGKRGQALAPHKEYAKPLPGTVGAALAAINP